MVMMMMMMMYSVWCHAIHHRVLLLLLFYWYVFNVRSARNLMLAEYFFILKLFLVRASNLTLSLLISVHWSVLLLSELV